MNTKIRQPYKLAEGDTLPVMLDIRGTGRDSIALPYSYLEMVQYDPSAAILLTFATCEIRIVGHNLPELYTAIVKHSVEYIQENDAKYEADVSEKEPFISRIEVKPLGDELELIVKSFDPDRESLAEDTTSIVGG